MRLIKAVVGSFAPEHGPIKNVIRSNLELQLKYGINIVSDGEPRSDMIQYFQQIPGLKKTPKGLCVWGRVKPMEVPRDFVKVKDYEYLHSILNKEGREEVQIKTTITGPITLGFFCAIQGVKYYSGLLDLRLYQDFADALEPLLLELLNRGSIVQVDEPVLSQKAMPAETAIKIINSMLEGIPERILAKGRLSTHICGVLTEDLFKSLLNLNVGTLSFAFSKVEERNIQILSKECLSKQNKKIGIGCISVQAVNTKEVEHPDTIAKRIRTVADIIGFENIAYIHPDCGLRSTPKIVAEEILKNLNFASEEIERITE